LARYNGDSKIEICDSQIPNRGRLLFKYNIVISFLMQDKKNVSIEHKKGLKNYKN
jgi:hypothetical protein